MGMGNKELQDRPKEQTPSLGPEICYRQPCEAQFKYHL